MFAHRARHARYTPGMTRCLLPLVLPALLASCGSSVLQLPQQWVGTGQSGGATYNVSASLHRSGADLVGTYQLTGSRVGSGAMNAKVDGTLFAGTLKPDGSCTYDVTGTVTETRLTASFTPRSCLGGVSGEWVLLRQ